MFYLGLFLLLSANSGFLIGGALLKYLLLIGGVFCLSCFLFNVRYSSGVQAGVLIFLLSYYLSCVFLEYVFDHKITLLYLSFQLICLFLFMVGFLTSYSLCKLKYPTKFRMILFYLMSLLASLIFIKTQLFSDILIDSADTRDMGDDSLNPNGLAFTQSLLFLFLFLLGKPFCKQELFWLKTVTLSSVFISIVLTGARGAMLSLLLVVFLIVFLKFNSKARLKFVFLLLSGVGVLMMFNLDFGLNKFSAIFLRFNNLLGFFRGGDVDLSALERIKVYTYFWQNIGDFSFGQQGYQGYPHNIFLEIIMRFGVLGIPMFLLFFMSLIKVFQSIRRNVFFSKNICNVDANTMLSFLFLFSLIQSLTSLNLEMNRTLWLGAGYIFGSLNK